MADHLQESAPKHAVEPQDLNAITASMFEGHIGLEFTETKPDRVQARVTMNPVLRQATGVVHGGVYCSIVETVASWGGLLSLDGAAMSWASTTTQISYEACAMTTCSPKAPGLPWP